MITSNVEKLLGKEFCIRNKIDPTKEYIIEYVPAHSLLMFDRIDILAKLLYIQSFAADYKTDYYRSLYAAHIEAFSRGTYVERDQEETKNSLELYIDLFHKLYQSIKTNGFDRKTSVVPVGANNVILDGAHRVSCAALLNIEIPIIRFPSIQLHCGFHFFEERLLRIDYLDFLAYQYCRIDHHIHCVLFWAVGKQKNKLTPEVEGLLSVSQAVIWKRTITLPLHALKNAAISLSSFDKTNDFPFPACTANAEAAKNSSVNLTLFLLQNKHADSWPAIKRRLADSFGKGNIPALITDTHDQAMEIAQVFLNRNTRCFLEHACFDQFPTMQKVLSDLKTVIKEKGIFPESFVVIDDALLALYGIRNTDSLSLVFDSQTEPIDGIISHCVCYSPDGADDLVHNPCNHFWYRGFKFVTVSKLIELKKNDAWKNTVYNKNDMKLLERIASKERKRPFQEEIRFKAKKAARNLKYRIRPAIMHNPVTGFALKCYHFFRHGRWF